MPIKSNPLDNGEIWSKDEDTKLGELVCKFVAEGKSLASAFREFEVITKGERTEGASKFRWFTVLNLQYAAAYEFAKAKGQEVKKAKKRKVNQGERYKEILGEVLNKEVDTEKEIQPDDFIVLAKKLKEQEYRRNEKITKIYKENQELREQLENLQIELKETTQLAKDRKIQLDNVLDALEKLKSAGINIDINKNISRPYKVNNGMVELA